MAGFMDEWLRPGERRLTAAEVRELPDGTAITLMSADRHGEKQWVDGRVITTKSGRKVFEQIGNPLFAERITIRNLSGMAWVLRK